MSARPEYPADLRELIAWLQLWHNHLYPEFGARLGDYFRDFLAEERRRLGHADSGPNPLGALAT